MASTQKKTTSAKTSAAKSKPAEKKPAGKNGKKNIIASGWNPSRNKYYSMVAAGLYASSFLR